MLDDANATPVLTSFGDGFKTLIFGAMGAIGGAFSDAVGQQANAGPLVTTSRSAGSFAASAQHFACDLVDESSIAAVATAVTEMAPFDLVINATGLLHDETIGVQPEKALRLGKANEPYGLKRLCSFLRKERAARPFDFLLCKEEGKIKKG